MRIRGTRLVAALATVFVLLTGPGLAAQEARTPEERLQEMERQMRQLQRQMEELRREILARAEPASDGDAVGGMEETAVAEEPSPPAGAWEVGYKEGGGGFYLLSPDGRFRLRQLGYVQFTGALLPDDFERADAPGDFSLRRARLDWLVDYDRYQLFVEIDGGPGSVPGSSDFALVVAQLTTDLTADGRFQFIGGKFISPLSSENRLSSRSLDTVERYLALNSMFLLPALDVQYGAMLRGEFLDRKLEVMAGVFNGNGRANDNLSDDNGDKELQLKLNYRPGDTVKFGLGFGYSNEEEQSLQLRGLSFTPWVAVPIRGTRRGLTADFLVGRGPWSLRGEGLYFDFEDAGAELAGGFVQVGRFLRGDALDGVQALLRLETAGIDSPLLGGPLPGGVSGDRIGDRIDALTLGLNWFWRGNYRWQIDAVGEHYHGLTNLPAGSSRVEGDGWKPYLLTQMQIKF